MSAAKHTPGPWVVEGYDEADGHGYNVAQAPGGYGKAITGWGCVTQTKANAARIVACVNACEGMADPAVEISGLRSRSDSIPAMCAEVEALRRHCGELAALMTSIDEACQQGRLTLDQARGEVLRLARNYDTVKRERDELAAAGRTVIARWESGDLSEAVRELAAALRIAYDALPVTATPSEFLAGHGNWSLTEQEYERALIYATVLAKVQS